MYHQYFGLSEAPFSIAVNPRYLFMSARHRDALAHLLYGVGAGGGFILLTGEVGTGKTTINRCLLEQLPDDTDVAIILNPALNAIELLASACDELGIEREPGQQTLKRLTDYLHDYLLQNHARGRKTVLMIDEAQHLDFDVLEQIRLLTNLETNSEKLLQIILIGQPELSQLLARPELRQLNQRITARYNLRPLNQSETSAYIQHRLQVAGVSPDRRIFPPSVVRGIYRHTRGIPRLINVLCDRILLGAYGRNKGRADMATLRQAAREVLGEDEGEDRRVWWPWVFAVLLATALGGALWQFFGPALLPPFAGIPTPASQSVAPAETPQPVAPEPASQPVVITAPAPEPAAQPEVKEETAPQQAWLQPRGDAAALLWSTASAAPMRGPLCEDPAGELACIEGEAATWDELATLQRPLLLDMVTPDRFAAGTVLLGLAGRQAWVVADGQPVQVDLAALAPLWTGRYRFLWHPPAGFERSLARGDHSPVVAEVAGLFARLDGKAQPLAGETFNDALQRRVMLFQRAQGLEADGVVGVRTLLELNRLLGLDATSEQARLALSAPAPEAGS